jgi:hypothetical protein
MADGCDTSSRCHNTGESCRSVIPRQQTASSDLQQYAAAEAVHLQHWAINS